MKYIVYLVLVAWYICGVAVGKGFWMTWFYIVLPPVGMAAFAKVLLRFFGVQP